MRELPVLLLALVAVGCRSKVATLRDALLDEDGAPAASVVDAPACVDASCLDSIARRLGAKHGFESNDPDQASAGAVALVLVRDRRGDVVPDPDRWIAALTEARGFGADALRLAVARGMAEMAPRLGDPLLDEFAVAKLVHDLSGVLPGACPTYALMGGTPVDRLPAGKGPDTAVCVQRDLERKDGPGARFGSGVWRAAAAIVALWKDDARALRSGLGAADEVVRPALEKKLAVIEGASAPIERQIKAKKAAGESSVRQSAP
ncbi:MAG TPA: hypothetical protein VIJ22_03830 [Polyangiaceae bacterium]